MLTGPDSQWIWLGDEEAAGSHPATPVQVTGRGDRTGGVQ